MHDERSVLGAIARAAAPHVGGDPSDVVRLSGGTSKGVYRVRGKQGPTAVVYRWHPDEDRWPSAIHSEVEKERASEGRHAFLSAHALLDSIGLRVPALHADEAIDARVDGYLAVVEDLGERTLADLLYGTSPPGDDVLHDFAAMVRRLHAEQRSRPGPLDVPNLSTPPTAFHNQIVSRAERDLFAAREHPSLRALVPRLESLLSGLAQQVRQRSRWTLLHGELGPDHVMVTDNGRPCLIDIEGLTYGDLEWEHAYLALRLGSWYRVLHGVKLDPARLELYTLTHHLSLVAGPMLLLSAIGPDERFEGIVAHNAARLVDLAQGKTATSDPGN